LSTPFPIVFANDPIGLNPLSQFDDAFQFATNGAYMQDNTLPASALLNSGVTAGTYGDAGHVAQVTVNAKGLLTSVSAIAIQIAASQITGQLAIANGGTGAATANGALNALLPSQTGNAGKILQTDGTNTSWQIGSGGVTPVATRTALAALSTALGVAFLEEAGRQGNFVWNSANLSAKVTLDTQQGVYVAPASDPSGASGAWVRQFNEAVNVGWFGAKADNVTDVTANIQVADAVARALGLSVYIPGGPGGAAYVVAGLTIYTHSNWFGDGQGVTILLGNPASPSPVLITNQFAALTGTNTIGGPYQWSLKKMTIDGNKAHKSSGNGVSFYAYDYVLEDMVFQNAIWHNIYSEWAISGVVPVSSGGNEMAAHWNRVKTCYAGLNGLTFNGPHDSIINDFMPFENGQIGAWFNSSANYGSTGTTIDNAHSYGNGSWGFVISDWIRAGYIESESNLGGGGIHIAGGVGGPRLQADYVSVWNNLNGTPGLVDDTGNSHIGFLEAYSNSADGVDLNGGGSVIGSISTYQNTGAGLFFNTNGSHIAVSNVQSYSNGGVGVGFSAGNNSIGNIWVSGNTGGGVNIGTGLAGLTMRGQIQNNTGTGLAMGTLASPGGNMIDVAIFTNAGQTAYSGAQGNNFVRIAATGASTVPVNQVQT